MSDPTTWPAEKLDRTAGIIGALDSPSRIQILLLLHNRDHVVHELVRVLGKSQPLVSQHLRVLKDAGLVGATRSGREVVYSLAVPGVIATLESLSLLAERTQEEPKDELAERRKRTPDFIDASKSSGAAAAFGPLHEVTPDKDPGLKPDTPSPPS
ncbi:metalloregulator ArsR/SmtB family transcription factor [Corynebacterium appendicis]|uniref:ArsR/SmtB family transcription factor n=1 Tax=Corynebacterium appendicis TaxID=163202 RepID=UPI0021AEBE1D|nr:metalloregulator ArsR/SmtB family transcription factor [Corynebacterium appendicis]MCT1683378.1 metalloregulator ArsR/SmtB family transcription factor [Corynebacterium appendicis]